MLLNIIFRQGTFKANSQLWDIIFVNWRSFKSDEKCFLFFLFASVLKILLSELFGNVEKQLNYEDNCSTHYPISQEVKGRQTMEFGQLI